MFRLFRLDPPNGWRHVWWELAIVTAGVILALVAQQLVEAASWRSRAAEGRARLVDELKDHYAQLYEQSSVSACLDRQLDQLATRVMNGDALPTFHDEFYGPLVFRVPHRTYNQNIWQTLGENGVTTHFDPKFAARMSGYYTQIAALDAEMVVAEALDRDLAILSRGVALSPDVRLDMVRKIETLRRLYRVMAVDANQSLVTLHEVGVRPSAEERHVFLPRSRTTEYCRRNGYPVTEPDFEISKS